MSKPIIPAAALEQHTAILGKTGSGKTSTAKLAIEQVVAGGARVCVLDPIKSDWWGLTSSADGKRPGLPFHILGGPRGHVPLHASAGKAIGEIVSSGDLPLSIIDMADFAPGGQAHFFVDFAPTLIRRMRGVVYLVIEEAHLFAPKERAGLGAENMSIHWAKTLATAGRSKGIRLLLLTQRVQALHNALLGSCETLIAHRLSAPADQEPVLKWLKANASSGILEMVSAQLSSLKTGAAWVCSGEAKIFERMEFPRIKTFDNTATPTGDGDVQDVKQAPVDAEKLRAIVGEAVKEAEANDPKLLQARIKELERDNVRLRQGHNNALTYASNQLSEDVIDAQARGRREGYLVALEKVREASDGMEGWADLIQRPIRDFNAQLDGLIAVAEKDLAAVAISETKAQRPAAAPGPAQAPKRTSRGPGDALPKVERQLLIVLAQRHPKPASRSQLSILSGYSSTSSSFSNGLGAIRSKGWSNGYGDDNRITEAGLKALGSYEALPTGRNLITWWLGRLQKAERTMLEYIAGRYPSTVSKEELAGETGYSITSSSYSNALGKLRSLELIQRGDIKASEELFG